MLVRWARRGGIFEAEDVARAVGRVVWMLERLRSTALYRDVCRASERHAEVPLSVYAGQQVLHGVLDLLYCDRGGQRRPPEWKTEPVVKGQTLREAAAPYLRQMAVYSHAVEQILGIRAQAEICFLTGRAALYNPSPDELAAEWGALLAGSQGENP